MTQVGMHEAKTQLSRLVERALRGEEVVITRHGAPVVRLDPVRSPGRTFADLLGSVPELRASADFDDLPDDVAAALGVVD